MELQGRGRGQMRTGLRASSLLSSLAWGLLWAPLLGVWVVIPHFLRTQRIHPANGDEWWLLEGILIAVFVTFGLIGSLITWAILGTWNRLRNRGFQDPVWAQGLALLLFLPLLYFVTSALTELAMFRSLVGLKGYLPFVRTIAGCYAVACIVFLLLYRGILRCDPRPRPTSVVLTGIFGLILGLALAPSWGEPSFDAKANTAHLQPTGVPVRSRPPLLFVGIDSGSWKILQPLIDRGKAPVLGGLISSGIKGEVHAGWSPVWSAPAWASILSGYPREQTGVYQELVASAQGLPSFQIPLEFDFLLDPLYLVEYGIGARGGLLLLTPYPRSALQRRPVWELLHSAGLRVAVIRFRFTFPAEDEATYIISDYVGRDIWKLMGVWTQSDSGLVTPARMAPLLLARFSGMPTSARALVSTLLPHGGPSASREAFTTPADSLRISAEIDEQTIEASVDLIRSQPDIAAFFVYIGGFDTVCHAFWRYRFPHEFPEDPPDDAAVRQFGAVIDRYLEFVDAGVGRLIRAYRERPNVMVVADHGHEALHENRTYTGAHSMRDGVFIVAGPSVAHREGTTPVRYLDVAPTVLDLMGFAPLSEMQGTSRLAADGASSLSR